MTNCREFEARFGIEYEHCLRDKTPMSMLMIDIDRFKRINDNRGHASGDRVLRKLADVVRATVRAIDSGGTRGPAMIACRSPPARTDSRCMHLLQGQHKHHRTTSREEIWRAMQDVAGHWEEIVLWPPRKARS
nr:diguanylate cyclase [Cupriavidus sp. UYPR2.512]